MEKPQKRFRQDGLVTRYTRQTERSFLFYASLGMLIVWALRKLLID